MGTGFCEAMQVGVVAPERLRTIEAEITAARAVEAKLQREYAELYSAAERAKEKIETAKAGKRDELRVAHFRSVAACEDAEIGVAAQWDVIEGLEKRRTRIQKEISDNERAIAEAERIVNLASTECEKLARGLRVARETRSLQRVADLEPMVAAAERKRDDARREMESAWALRGGPLLMPPAAPGPKIPVVSAGQMEINKLEIELNLLNTRISPLERALAKARMKPDRPSEPFASGDVTKMSAELQPLLDRRVVIEKQLLEWRNKCAAGNVATTSKSDEEANQCHPFQVR